MVSLLIDHVQPYKIHNEARIHVFEQISFVWPKRISNCHRATKRGYQRCKTMHRKKKKASSGSRTSSTPTREIAMQSNFPKMKSSKPTLDFCFPSLWALCRLRVRRIAGPSTLQSDGTRCHTTRPTLSINPILYFMGTVDRTVESTSTACRRC